mgnify:CR=1 FL=1
MSKNKAPSQRQLRAGELIRRAIADIIARENLRDPGLSGVSVTISEVRASPDLKHAIVFAAPLGGGEADKVIAALNRNKHELRRAINKSITLKYSPDLKFVYDQTFDQMDETRRLLAQDHVQQDLSEDTE